MEQFAYKEQLIVKHSDNEFVYYLYNADGDIESYNCKSLEKAKEGIDKAIKRQGGFYNSDGELI